MRKAASEGIEGSKLAEAVMRKVRLRVKVTARAIRKVRARAIHHDAYYRYYHSRPPPATYPPQVQPLLGLLAAAFSKHEEAGG